MSYLHEFSEAEQNSWTKQTVGVRLSYEKFVVVVQILPNVFQTRLLYGNTAKYVLFNVKMIWHFCQKQYNNTYNDNIK